jgi:hypothetical protein
MVIDNNNEKEKETIKLKEEKTLEEVLLEKKINLSQNEVNNAIESVRVMKELKSDSSAREYLKQIVQEDKKITKYLHENYTKLKNNYTKTIEERLRLLSEKEGGNYKRLIEGFIKQDSIEKSFSFSDKLKLKFYKIIGDYNRFRLVYDKIGEEKAKEHINNKSVNLRNELGNIITTEENFRQKIIKTKGTMKTLETNLKSIKKELKLTRGVMQKLDYEKSSLNNDLDKNIDSDLVEAVEEDYEKLNEDIELIEENALDYIEDSKSIQSELFEKKKDLYKFKELKRFYRRAANNYKRSISFFIKLDERLTEGLSYTKAHKLIEDYVNIEKSINIFNDSQREKDNGDVQTINPGLTFTNVEMPNMKINRSKVDNKLIIDSAPEEIEEFFKNYKKW